MLEMMLFAAAAGGKEWIDVALCHRVAVAVTGDNVAKVIGGDKSWVPGLDGLKNVERIFGGNEGAFLIQFQDGTHAFCGGLRDISRNWSYYAPYNVDIGGRVRDAAFSEYYFAVARESGVFKQIGKGWGTNSPDPSEGPASYVVGVAISSNSVGYISGSGPTYHYEVYGGNDYYDYQRSGEGATQIACNEDNGYICVIGGSLYSWGNRGGGDASFVTKMPAGSNFQYMVNNKSYAIAVQDDNSVVQWGHMSLPLPLKIVEPTRVSVTAAGLAVIDKNGDLLIYTDNSEWWSIDSAYLVTQ